MKLIGIITGSKYATGYRTTRDTDSTTLEWVQKHTGKVAIFERDGVNYKVCSNGIELSSSFVSKVVPLKDTMRLVGSETSLNVQYVDYDADGKAFDIFTLEPYEVFDGYESGIPGDFISEGISYEICTCGTVHMSSRSKIDCSCGTNSRPYLNDLSGARWGSFYYTFGITRNVDGVLTYQDNRQYAVSPYMRGLTQLCVHCTTAYIPTENALLASTNALFGSNRHLCDSCAVDISEDHDEDEDYVRCSECGDTHYIDDSIYDDDLDAYLCHSCNDARQIHRIHNYTWQPNSFNFMRSQDEPNHERTIYRGVEIEVENHSSRDNTSNIARDFHEEVCNKIGDDFIYLKSDVSIDDGFEIVFHPMSYLWVKENEDKMKKFFDILRSYGLRSGISDGVISCGMHIHVTKEPLESVQTYKLTQLLYNNKEEFLKLADRFNKRRVKRYCYFPTMTDTDFEYYRETKSNNDKIEHHAALQFTAYSLEFRIFDGVSNFETYMRNMETVEAMLEFTNTRIRTMTFERFKTWVLKETDGKYSHLADDLNKKFGVK